MPMTTLREVEAAFAVALGESNSDLDEAPFPSNGRCECGSSSFQIVELGYVRVTDLELTYADEEEDGDIEDEDAFSPLQGAPTQFGPAVDDLIVTGATATVSGWSDFSDEGLYKVIVCCRCARLYDVFSLDVNCELKADYTSFEWQGWTYWTR